MNLRITYQMKTQTVLTFFGSAAAALAGCTDIPDENNSLLQTARSTSASDSPPNVLMIIADDLCDWTGFLGGHPQAYTPNLDKLAKRGVVFRNAYCNVPLSNPSRVALLSGISPARSGIYGNETLWQSSPVTRASISMPQHFRNNGYKTVVAGKVYHAFPEGEYVAAAWDDHSHEGGGYLPNPAEDGTWEQLLTSLTGCRIGAYVGTDKDIFPDWENANYVAQYVSQRHDKPFFAAMGFYRPHTPLTAPREYFEMMPAVDEIVLPEAPANDLADIPPYPKDNFLLNTEIKDSEVKAADLDQTLVRAYLACIAFMDDMVGKVIGALDNSPNADNTIVVFMGDNGYHHGEKNRWAKMSMWREACHVPLLIVGPKNGGGYAVNGYTGSEVNLLDIYPTLVDMCGLPDVPGNQLDGESIRRLVEVPTTRWENSYAFSCMLGSERAVRKGGYSYILYKTGVEELYNLMEDENEWINLASLPLYREKKNQMRSIAESITLAPRITQ